MPPLLGTRGYMPPEQEVDGVVTPVSDVYALGGTFEQLFWESQSTSSLHRRRRANRSAP
jgi:serine/threonine protein kinase